MKFAAALIPILLLGMACRGALVPYVTEFIVPFDMPIDDLKTVVANQLSHNEFRTSEFTTDGVAVKGLVYRATYNGSEKSVSPPYITSETDLPPPNTSWSETALT
jgi:alkyl hydroperoxide reductase subunit AhpF